MRRRSILGMFAAAPVAAAVNPNPQIMDIPKVHARASWSPPLSAFDDDEYELEQDPVKRAMMRRKAIYNLYKEGALEDGDGWDEHESPNIVSLKATSLVRKAQLQREWRMKRKLLRADMHVERTIKQMLLPKWMHRWT
jgi:hypothetical protein